MVAARLLGTSRAHRAQAVSRRERARRSMVISFLMRERAERPGVEGLAWSAGNRDKIITLFIIYIDGDTQEKVSTF